jgi:hypothetical protein
MWGREIATVFAVVALLHPTAAGADAVLSFDPASPAALVSRIRAVDLARLGADLSDGGLELPTRLDVALLSEADERVRAVPYWITGLALEPTTVVIFHERVLRYPYDSLESVFRHEVTHLALSSRAGGRPLPRWLHEGVAMSVDRGWDTRGRFRLLLEMTGSPATDDLTRLFASASQPDAAQAYGLSAALVADIEQRHGRTAPARIAARVALGIPFATAFEQETGETPDQAAGHAWRTYRRWTIWVAAITSETAIWAVIVVLAVAGSFVQIRRRSRRRARWDELESMNVEEHSQRHR